MLDKFIRQKSCKAGIIRRGGLSLLFIICIFCARLFGYGYNKVITSDFDWNIESFGKFDIYYYGESGKRLLPYARTYLKDAHNKSLDLFQIVSKDQIPFFLYNNHNEFEQTNVTFIGEGTGGVTEAYKNRFLVGHTGSQKYLQYVITHEFMHEVEFDYLFGGFWRSIRIIKFIFYPNWLMEGLAEYLAGDKDITVREMHLRDATLSNNLLPLEQMHSFNHVMPHQITLAYKESEALMRYIADEYGADKLPKLLVSYTNYFDPDSVLREVLGTNLSTLDRKFREYMEDKYTVLASSMLEPGAYGRKITKSGAYPVFFESAVFVPNSKDVVYISDISGSKEIFKMNIETGKKTSLVNMVIPGLLENIHITGRGLSVSNDGSFMIFCGEFSQKDYLYVYNFKSKIIDRIDVETETAASPAISKDGKSIIYSGIKKGYSDLFLYNLSSKKSEQLTNDAVEEKDVVFSPDGSEILYSKEKFLRSDKIEYDIEKMNLNTQKEEVLISLPGDEKTPCFDGSGKRIYFISDQDYKYDIYSYDLINKEIKRLTNVVGGNFQPVVSNDGKMLLFSSFRNSEKHLYMMNIEDESVSVDFNAKHEKYETTFSSSSLVAKSTSTIVKKYKFSPSTDLFFPALFYSSLDGLFIATYYQASDLVGNHQLQSILTYASGAEYIDYQLMYGFLRFRPQFYLSLTGKEYYWDYTRTLKIREHNQSLITAYPLNRFQRVEFLFSTIIRHETDTEPPQVDLRSRENIFGLAFIHDVTRAPYLETMSGWRMKVAGEFSERVLSGDYKYQNYIIETHKYFPIGLENTIGIRNMLGGSFDENAGWFRLGGMDRVRGYPADFSYAGHKIFLTSVEWRFPIVHNINYHMWYFFPDFFFKTFYGSIFVDSGLTWNNDSELEEIGPETLKGSYGISFRFHTFILQSYPLLLNLQLARRMDGPTAILYLTFGSNF